mgnify:CR=1 FL=1
MFLLLTPRDSDWPAILAVEQLDELRRYVVAADRPMELIGVQPIETTADALQFDGAFAHHRALMATGARGLQVAEDALQQPALKQPHGLGRDLEHSAVVPF